MRKTMSRTLAGVSLLGLISTAHAQTADQEPSSPDEIVVTAQKRVERLADTPLSVTALSGEALLDRGITAPENLTNVVPGLSFQKSPFGTPIYSIRGVGYYDRIVGATPTVSVYQDQVPITYSFEAAGVALDLQRVEVLKGTQGTLFGNNSTGGAINFIANKPTDVLSGGFNLDVGRFDSVNAEAFVSGPLAATLKFRLAGRHEYSGPWQKSYAPNDIQFGAPTGRKHGRRDFTAGRFLLDWEPGDNVRFELNANGWMDKSDTQAPAMVAFTPQRPLNAFNDAVYRAFNINPAFLAADTPPGNAAAAPLFVPLPGTPEDNRLANWDPGEDLSKDDWFYQVSLAGEISLSDAISLNSVTAVARARQDQLIDVDGTSYVGARNIAKARVENFYQELRLSDTEGPLNWILGVNYAHDVSKERNVYSPQVNVTQANFPVKANDIASLIDQDARTYAAFGQVTYKLTEQLSIDGAIRYTKHKRRFEGCSADSGDGTAAAFFNFVFGLQGVPLTVLPGQCFTQATPGVLADPLIVKELDEDNVSWRANVSWKPSRNLLFYANVTKGYKSGGFSAIQALVADSYNPVKQESVLAIEGGLKGSFLDNAISLDLALFHMSYRDKQMTGSANSFFGIVPSLVNVPKSRINGFEFNTTFRPTQGLRLTAGGTYLDSKVTQDPAIPIGPDGVAQTFVGEPLPTTPKWNLIGDAEYRAPLSDGLEGFVNVNATYQGSTQTTLGQVAMFQLPDYTLIGFRVGVDGGNGRWGASIWGRNITNEYYAQSILRLFDTVSRYTGTPATYGVTLRFNM